MEKVLVLEAQSLEILDRIPDPFAHIPVDLDDPDPQLEEVWEKIRTQYGDVVLAQDATKVKRHG